jgi:hypothetical protein
MRIEIVEREMSAQTEDSPKSNFPDTLFVSAYPRSCSKL